jgi:sigma-54 dependent transcriptional regulator, acetoin dehydrogenase operon transcriptional activator AcoR
VSVMTDRQARHEGLTRRRHSTVARETVAASRRRSVLAGVRSHRFDVPYEPEVDTERHLDRTALAVLERAGDDLVDTPFSLVVANERARVIERVDGNPSLAAKLDRLHLVPGYRWSEQCIGTNAIGTALAHEASVSVRGREHFAEALSDVACVATPIIDPRHGRPVGVVALICRDDAATTLMLSYVRRIGWEIENGLVNDASAAERTLMAHFVRIRRHARGAIVSVNERTMITNAAAARLVDEADHSTLWELVRSAIARGETQAGELRLSTGITVTVRCEPVDSATETVGALVHLDVPLRVSSARSRPSTKKRGRRQNFGWSSLSPSQLGIAELVASGLTNQEVAARLYLSRHTIDFHLREIYSKLGIDSRVKLARLVSEHHADQQLLAS